MTAASLPGSCRGASGRPGLFLPGIKVALLAFLAISARSAFGAALPELLSQARETCRKHPDSVRALDRLAALELRSYRTTHAAESIAAAETAVDRALAKDSSDFDARRFRLAIRLTNHEFAEVEREGALLLAERPRDGDVLGMIADAQMESGRYPEAIETIQRMVDLRPGLPSYSRVSYAREIHGDLAGALDAMDLAVAAGDPSDAEGLSWCLARSGLLAWKLGRIDDASRRFESARRLFPQSPYAWEGIGFVAQARGDLPAAARAFERAFEAVPWPQYAVERSEVAMAAGHPDEARRWQSIVRAIERLSEEAGRFNRVLALYESDFGDPARGLAMARGELASRKDVSGWDAYAWALYRSGNAAEAAAAERNAVAFGTEDPMLDARAGIVFEAAGDLDAARLHLSRALRANPAFHLLRAAEARARLARLDPAAELASRTSR